jgi:hypothetical protein
MRTTIGKHGILDGSGLTPLAQRFEAWRRGKRRGERSPEELWNAAVEAALIHGLGRTSKALRLSFYDLKKRVSPDPRPWAKLSRQTFIEMPPTAVSPGPNEHAGMELTRPCGTKLFLRLPNALVGDFLPRVEAFLGS